MSMVVTSDGLVDESTVNWRLWREDSGDSWSIIHELSVMDGSVRRVVRRDVWVNFKGSGLPAAGSQQGGL